MARQERFPLGTPSQTLNTTLYKCAGCTVMFLDPERFSKQIRYTFDPERSWSEQKPMRPDALSSIGGKAPQV